ncbi:solute carrier family 28 member 3-like [Gigantopelta aegis]|uniref:solute carrier family 28 member 3-like n=1 Tax=Gigantopelta aegis TaxID=1735272 RepID=UPI001B88CD5C|nr:solute carrier family 28 member 3-like [Gigantopelta aegis]
MSNLNTSDSQKPLFAQRDDSVLSIQVEDEEATTDMCFLPEKAEPDGCMDNKEVPSVTMCIDDSIISGSSDSSDSGNSSLLSSLGMMHAKMEGFVGDNKKKLKLIIFTCLGLGYLGYFIAALILGVVYKCVDTVPLIAVTCVVFSLIVISFVKDKFGKDIFDHCLKPVLEALHKKWYILKWVGFALIYGGVVAVIITSVWSSPRNLISLVGMAMFILILFICSVSPLKVNWRPVVGGLTLQFYFAVLILKWDVGYKVFRFLGHEVQTFLSYTDYGSEFVFGKKYIDHIFAMKVLPVVVFFSCFISVLYYIGAMQAIIGKIAWLMRVTLGTTVAESLCAAGNIFVGQTEAPILIRPFLNVMTKSELHAVMVGGFATIAGGVLAAYVSFGVPPEHLLCASVLNAPCALAVSKLLYPETEKSHITKAKHIDTDSDHRNLLEAAAAGASSSIVLVANIAANLIAFLALLAFVNATLSWFGGFICHPELSFELICSYVFMPITYLMGVEWKDAGVVGELVGIKTFLNEFVAYKELAKFITNRQECLQGTVLSIRSEIIATYALCGFSNLSSIGIQLGGLGPMAPKRSGDLAQIVIRALFGGIIACLMTASLAGLLMIEPVYDSLCAGNVTDINSTLIYNSSDFVTTETVTSFTTGLISNVTELVLNATTGS